MIEPNTIEPNNALPQSPRMIELKNIERSYKTGAGQTWVLRRIQLEIREFAAHAEREVHLFDGKAVSEDELKKKLSEVQA